MREAEPMRVMLVDDDDAFRAALTESFEIAGLRVESHADGEAALAVLTPDYPGVLIVDIRMPKVDGHGVLDTALARDPDLPVILMTGHGDIAMAVAALHRGAHDFVAKPFATEPLIASLRRAMETRRLTLENRRLALAAAEVQESFPLLGETPAMVRLRETIRQVAGIDVDVLIEGETGTGKELVARLLHGWGLRRARPFVAIDCAALPDTLADETLFGSRLHRGRIAEADRGTLFLDEIDRMSPALQGKLLRVIEERELPSLTGGPLRSVDLRMVAAAKEDLGAAVAEGRLRSDLFYRLEAVRLRLPPLRERRSDIGLMFAYFLGEAAARFNRPRPAIDAAIEARLASHDWPGNVRELRNFATQVVLGLAAPAPPAAPDLSLAERMDRFEADVIRAVLDRLRGDVTLAADELMLPRRSLYARLQRLGIEPAEFRQRG